MGACKRLLILMNKRSYCDGRDSRDHITGPSLAEANQKKNISSLVLDIPLLSFED